MSTQFTVGVADDTRISSKVLKPPGGGSSLFFGESGEELSPRRVKNHQASNLPLGDVENNKNGNSSGESVDGTSTPSQSSTSNGSPANSEPTTPRSGTPLLNGPISYDSDLPTPIRPHGRRLQGNPVTGEGYTEETEAAPPKKEETPRRQRVPPGGFSSKLW